jgi:hypothetical protein
MWRVRHVLRALDFFSPATGRWWGGGLLTLLVGACMGAYAAAQLYWHVTEPDAERSLASTETPTSPIPFLAGCRYAPGTPILCLLRLHTGVVIPLLEPSPHIPPNAANERMYVASALTRGVTDGEAAYSIIALYNGAFMAARDTVLDPAQPLPAFVAAKEVELMPGGTAVCDACAAAHPITNVSFLTRAAFGRRRGAAMARYATHNKTESEFMASLFNQASHWDDAGDDGADTLRLTKWNIAGDADRGPADNCTQTIAAAFAAMGRSPAGFDTCTQSGLARLGYRFDVVTEPPEPVGSVLGRVVSICVGLNFCGYMANRTLFRLVGSHVDPHAHKHVVATIPTAPLWSSDSDSEDGNDSSSDMALTANGASSPASVSMVTLTSSVPVATIPTTKAEEAAECRAMNEHFQRLVASAVEKAERERNLRPERDSVPEPVQGWP